MSVGVTRDLLCVGEGASAPADTANVVGAPGDRPAGAHETFVQVEQLQQHLCGRSRPHFFKGVATVGDTQPCLRVTPQSPAASACMCVSMHDIARLVAM